MCNDTKIKFVLNLFTIDRKGLGRKVHMQMVTTNKEAIVVGALPCNGRGRRTMPQHNTM